MIGLQGDKGALGVPGEKGNKGILGNKGQQGAQGYFIGLIFKPKMAIL
jgi:hypothetical protein